MNKTLATVAVLSALSCLASTPLRAEGYVGFSYGESNADVGVSDFDDGSLSNGMVDDTDSAWKVFGGWHAKWVGVEAAWQDLGSFSVAAESDGSGSIYAPGDVRWTLDAQGFSAELLGRIPLGKVLVIFGKVGALWWTSETTASGPVVRIRVDDSSLDLMYGAGLDIVIKKISLRLEYERFDQVSNDETAVDLASAGIMFNF